MRNVYELRRAAFVLAAMACLLSGRAVLAQEPTGRQTDPAAEPDPTAPGASELRRIYTRSLAPQGGYWIGVDLDVVPPAVQAQLGLDERGGLHVTGVGEKSPAEEAGIAVHDIIVEANGKPLREPHDLSKLINRSAEQEIVLQVIRAGKTRDVTVRPGKRPQNNSLTDIIIYAEPSAAVLDPAIDAWKGRPAAVRDELILGVQPERIPEDLTVTIRKKGGEPAQITVQQGYILWEVSEDDLRKGLSVTQLPPHVHKLLKEGVLLVPKPNYREFLFKLQGEQTVTLAAPIEVPAHASPAHQSYRAREERHSDDARLEEITRRVVRELSANWPQQNQQPAAPEPSKLERQVEELNRKFDELSKAIEKLAVPAQAPPAE